jgi:hypothetical protein
MKVNWANAASGIRPFTERGTPAARRMAARPVVAAAAKTPTVAVARGSVLVSRELVCSTAMSEEAVVVDMEEFLSRRRF